MDGLLACKNTAQASSSPSNNGCDPRIAMTTMVDGILGVTLKMAKRLLELNQSEMAIMKRLFVELMGSPPEHARIEIIQTIVELAVPDESVGNLSSNRKSNPEARQRVRTAREYIGIQIRKCRESLGMTQTQLARKARIPQSHVSRLETGKLAPTRRTIERLSKVLKVRPADLDPGLPDDPDAPF